MKEMPYFTHACMQSCVFSFHFIHVIFPSFISCFSSVSRVTCFKPIFSHASAARDTHEQSCWRRLLFHWSIALGGRADDRYQCVLHLQPLVPHFCFRGKVRKILKKGRGFFKGDVFHMLPCLVKQNYIKSKVFKGNFTGNFGGMYWKNNKNIPAARKARLHFGQILWKCDFTAKQTSSCPNICKNCGLLLNGCQRLPKAKCHFYRLHVRCFFSPSGAVRCGSTSHASCGPSPHTCWHKQRYIDT